MDELVSATSDIGNFSLTDSYFCSPEETCQYFPDCNTSLKILHLNIRSINCNFDEFTVILHRIKLDIDVIILSECWLSKCPSLPVLPGFDSFSSDFKTQNEGVVAYVRVGITCAVENLEFSDANCLLIKCEKSVAIVALYRSPSVKNIEPFLCSLDGTLTTLKEFTTIAVIGDININIVPNANDTNSDDYLNLLAAHAMLPTYDSPTRLNSCLDHIILKSPHPAVSLILNSMITDHAPTLCSINMTIKSKPPKPITKIDIPAIIKEIEITDFSQILSSNNPNCTTQTLVETLSNIVKKHSQILTLPSKKRVIKPWITPGLLKCIRHRDKLYRKHKKNIHNEILKITFTRYRNFCNNLLKKIKREYERAELRKVKNSPKTTWKLVKKIANLDRKRSSSEELLKISASPKASVNIVNKFFANVGKDLASQINPPFLPNNLPRPEAALPNTSPIDSMALLPTDPTEIENIILGLKDKCAAGWDGIPTLVIKGARSILIPVLHHIFNLCLSTSTFPSAFKKALVHPIYKGGDKKDINNFRPISVLSVLSKIFEKIINRRLLGFFNENHVFSDNQFGFRSCRSTEDAVVKLTSTIVKNFDGNLKTVGVFLDLSKAFDTVSVSILLDKLERVGIRGSVNDLFRSYLTDRSQEVVINGVTSNEEPIHYGVPQGSVLGPSLFLVYINELCKLSLPNPNCHIITYADDTALLVGGKSWGEVQCLAEAALRLIFNWLSTNLLTLNVKKSHFITFSPTARTQPLTFSLRAHTCPVPVSYSCSCQILHQVTSIKYLGVYVDRFLSWTPHIEYTIARVRKLIFVFKNLRSVADFQCLRTVYFALAQSILNYCITAWGGSIKTQMLRVERAQRAVLKVMSSRPRKFSTSLLLSQCEVLSVRQLFVLATVLRQHQNLFFDPEHLVNKRRSDIVCKIKPRRTAIAGRHFYYLSSPLYNRVNRALDIYPLPLHKCKTKCLNWLLSLSYEQTEDLLIPLS